MNLALILHKFAMRLALILHLFGTWYGCACVCVCGGGVDRYLGLELVLGY